MRPTVLVVLAACGRLYFDPIGGRDVDGGVRGVDAQGNAGADTCMSAGTVGFPSMLVGESIAGAASDYPGTCGNGPDLVYAIDLTASTMVTYTILATFTGGIVVTQTCPPVGGSCTGFVSGISTPNSVTLSAGRLYFILYKSGGAGTTFDISFH